MTTEIASSTATATTTTKKKQQRGWIFYRTPPDLTDALETVFLNMQIRKTSRALTGSKKRSNSHDFFALAILLVVIYSFGANSQRNDEDGEVPVDSELFVTLTFREVIIIGIWLYLAAFITSVFSESRFLELLKWMFVYLPLLSMLVTILFERGNRLSNSELNYFDNGAFVGFMLFMAEVMSIALFVGRYYIFPKMINSKIFRRKRRPARYWRIETISDWTMTYVSNKHLLMRRHTCKYHGETNADGLPHGVGRWFDDSWEGEVLTGTWKDGFPVAPFNSRHYGRGDLFSAVRIAYVMASDDTWDSTHFWPSNKNPPRCGIGSVECSVAGHFYNELPHASQLQEEKEFDEATSIATLCRELRHIGAEEKNPTTLIIKADDPRGVQIDGHVHSVTGQTFNKVDEILITVQPVAGKPGTSPHGRFPFMYMPFSNHSIFGSERISVRESAKTEQEKEKANPSAKRGDEELEAPKTTPPEMKLKVQDWIPAKEKDALVFIAGFNCSLEQALEGFGQFIAMTKLDCIVYPILYGFPCGSVLSYHSASRTSHRPQNKKNFLSLMKSLQNSGIRNVHLMSHSMGAQTLVGAFCDNEDGSRSDVSKCFRLASGWEEGPMTKSNVPSQDGIVEDNLLVCKTLTMLNPDYPLDAFVNHAFRSIRRICRTVTVVGDRTDGALYFSQLVNGIGVRFGYKQPRELQPNNRNKESLRYQYVVGRSIENLFLREATTTNRTYSKSLIFSDQAPLTIVSEEEDLDRQWLDLDVIDTSGLDTNIANIRHSAFNLNPMLLNDLEELISTSRRAMKRTSLLYRDGNLFSYCHAPSHVAY